MGSEPSEDELHLRYLDWCSTRVARRFLELTDDEVWLRSHLAETLVDAEASGRTVDAAGSGAHGAAPIPGFLDLVRRTAVLLAAEMNLPSFEEWKKLYAEDPAAYGSDLLGA